MKLSISNIAWGQEADNSVYNLMKANGFTGIEIAPTRIFDNPYSKAAQAADWSMELKESFGFTVVSMQSIWYGRNENIFANKDEWDALLDYTKKAIDFASAVGCRNLVFGCPRNRNMPEGAKKDTAAAFFKELGDYAADKHIVVGMEANPAFYGTNFINDTLSAFEFVEEINSKGFLVNLDTGTMIANGESADELCGRVCNISHVHISEPGLKPVTGRALHKEIARVLKEEGYQGYVSIEMGRQDDISVIESGMAYVKEVFGDV